MKKYKVVLRYFGRADLKRWQRGELVPVSVVVDDPKLVRVVPFPAPDVEADDYVAIYEFVPVEAGE